MLKNRVRKVIRQLRLDVPPTLIRLSDLNGSYTYIYNGEKISKIKGKKLIDGGVKTYIDLFGMQKLCDKDIELDMSNINRFSGV
jgi:hypothetical protein